jgi:cystathionine beta-synthase
MIEKQQIYSGLEKIIGCTPVIELTQFDTGPCRLFAKMELMNPSGSMKDRTAWYMIKAAEQAGVIKPGDVLIEGTAGNTGISLATIGIPRGYRCRCLVPDKMSRNKIDKLQRLGAEVELVRSDVGRDHPEHFLNLARDYANTNNDVYFIDQFQNEANILAHYETTAPELWKQIDSLTQKPLDAFVAGVGTGGSLTGIGRYLKEKNKSVEIILADPQGSLLGSQIDPTIKPVNVPWIAEGIGSRFMPSLLDSSLIDQVRTVDRQQTLDHSHALLKKTGIFSGPSTGAVLAATLDWCRDQTMEKQVAILIADSGQQYIDTIYNPQWIEDNRLTL